ncbi:MAG: hypothetical protein FJX57_24815, partial [Alphaproteobacteria bacterium]|nr:hypothetical protein [Alphaproteobacteria bacterium]
MSDVRRLLEDALVERQPRQLAVDVATALRADGHSRPRGSVVVVRVHARSHDAVEGAYTMWLPRRAIVAHVTSGRRARLVNVKEIILFRHAKSSWATAGTADFDRALTRRGRRAAPMMAAWLAAAGGRPDLILCSAAARTQETLRLVQPLLQPRNIVIERGLYLAAADALKARIERIGSEVSRAMLIGHNPGLETLAQELDPGASAES